MRKPFEELTIKDVLATVMVVGSIFLMQWHSIEFWTDKVGESGLYLSIGLEAAMLWFWYDSRNRFIEFCKYLAAFLLIAGPWYQITAPTFQNLNSMTVMQADIEMAQDAIKQLSTSLDRDEKIRDKRFGWKDTLKETRADLKEARAHLSTLRAKKVKHDTPWRSRAVAGMQAAILFLMLTAQLTAVTYLRSRNVTTVTEGVTPKRNGRRNAVTEQPPERYEETVKAVVEEITRREKELGSRAEICRQAGIRPEYVTAVMNHEEKKRTCGAITPNGLKKIVDALGVVV